MREMHHPCGFGLFYKPQGAFFKGAGRTFQETLGSSLGLLCGPRGKVSSLGKF